MLTTEQKEEYNELKDEVRPYIGYLRWQKKIDKFGPIIPIVILLVFGVVYYFAGQAIGSYVFLAFFFISFIMVIISVSLQHLAKRSQVSTDKMTSYLVYSIIDNLDRFFDPKRADTPSKKKKFRDEAIICSLDLMSIIQEKWVVGKFGLSEELLGKPVRTFKELLTKRLVPAIKEGDPNTILKSTNDVFFQLSFFLNQPSIESLNHINESIINKNIPEGRKENFMTKSTGFFSSYGFMKHPFWVLVITTVSVVIFFLGKNFSGTDFEALSLAVTSWAVLLAGYFIFFKKK
jgi:hypothetical protein